MSVSLSVGLGFFICFIFKKRKEETLSIFPVWKKILLYVRRNHDKCLERTWMIEVNTQ